MQLASKTRIGSKVVKKYDVAKTSFRRVLDSDDISIDKKRKLKNNYDNINPAQLKRKITDLQDRLIKLNVLKQKVKKDMEQNDKLYEYICT